MDKLAFVVNEEDLWGYLEIVFAVYVCLVISCAHFCFHPFNPRHLFYNRREFILKPAKHQNVFIDGQDEGSVVGTHAHAVPFPGQGHLSFRDQKKVLYGLF